MHITENTTLIPTQIIPRDQLEFSALDAQLLRDLAGHVAALAARPGEQVKRDLWRRHNRLEKTRPLIFCDPENSWKEIIPDAALRCQNPIAREWEFHLRRQIFWGEQMGDDYTIEPYFNVAHVRSKPNWGLVEQLVGGEHGGAYTWDSPIKTEADIDRLRFPTFKPIIQGTTYHVRQTTPVQGAAPPTCRCCPLGAVRRGTRGQAQGLYCPRSADPA